MKRFAMGLVVLAVGCGKKSAPTVQPDPPVVVASTAPSVAPSASAPAPAPKGCRLVEVPRADAGTPRAELSWQVEGEDGYGGGDGPVLRVKRSGKELSANLFAQTGDDIDGFWPENATSASDGERLMVFLVGNHRSRCHRSNCKLDWREGTCACMFAGSRDSPNFYNKHKTDAEPAARLVVQTGGALSVHDYDARDERQIGEPKGGGLALMSHGAVLAYRATGAMWAIALGDDGEAAEGTKPTLVAGGNLRTPQVARGSLDGAERAWLVWTQLPKGKEDWSFQQASFDPTTGKAGIPRVLARTAGTTGSVSSYGIARDGEGIALAWTEAEGKRVHLYFGRGAKPAEAAASAVELAFYDGAPPVITALTVVGTLPILAFESSTSHVVCR